MRRLLAALAALVVVLWLAFRRQRRPVSAREDDATPLDLSTDGLGPGGRRLVRRRGPVVSR